MITRKLQSPGVEINEIDRSQYNKVDYSLPNAPTSLMFGFASKGEDSTFKWINSKSTLDETYGQPTTEFEAYFYNAAMEILNHGGTCIAAKLPYMNNSYNKYNFVEYSLGDLHSIQLSQLTINQKYNTIGDLQYTLNQILQQLNEQYDITSIIKMKNACDYIYTKYLSQKNVINVINDIKISLQNFINQYKTNTEYIDLFLNDSNLTSYFNITFTQSDKSTLEEFDNLLTKTTTIKNNRIRIYDITRSSYQKFNSVDQLILSKSQNNNLNSELYTNDFLGIIPVIVTPINAMFFQNILQFSTPLSDINYDLYNSIGSLTTVNNPNIDNTNLSSIDNYLTIPLQSKSYNDDYNTDIYNNVSLSRLAAQQFPFINYNGFSHFDTTYLKQIGIVVFKAYKDMDNNGKINYQLLESFIGSLDKNAKDEITHSSIFIDDIINSTSKYIRVFSTADQHKLEQASTVIMSNQPVASLGFYQIDTEKNIHFINSIINPLTHLLDNASNKYTLPLDIIIDAGISNIAQLAKINTIIYTDRNSRFSDYSNSQIQSKNDIAGWSLVLQKFDNFCKNIRKDCMFIADGLRSFCLDGDLKYVRKSAPYNTVTNCIISKLKYMTNILNSSYSAGYCNWFYQPDYSNTYNYLWIPPSIKAAGVYTYCDIYAHPWSAPAGITRATIKDAIDIAFIPLESDANQIYSNEWNYAMSYPLDGIIIEGHKTFQMQRTALDRINVRRLLLWLEKQVIQVARKFVYEGNTPYLRQLFVDTLRPIFEQAVSGYGILEYGIKCDDELNTPQVIENNELRCKIAVKPVKVVDWIVIDLISTKQSANISEELIK